MIQTKLLKTAFILFLVLLFLFLVVSRTPAAWAAWAVQQAMPNVWLSSVEGTLWRGTAKSAQVDLGPAPLALGEVRWSLNPFSLLVAQPCVTFSTKLPGQTLTGKLCQSVFSQQTRVSDMRLDAPISVLKPILPIDASGFVSILVNRASFRADAYVEEIDGQMSWENARANTGQSWINLGTFGATAKENGEGGIAAEVFDVAGPYTSRLDAQWSVNTDWVVNGTIAPQQGAADIVVQGLKILGEDMGDGSYRVQWP